MNTEVTLGRLRFQQFDSCVPTKYLHAKSENPHCTFATTPDTTYTSLIKDVEFLGRFHSATIRNGEIYYTFFNTQTGKFKEIHIDPNGYRSFFASFDKLSEDQKKTILPDDSK
jgi:hypothetical protein